MQHILQAIHIASESFVQAGIGHELPQGPFTGVKRVNLRAQIVKDAVDATVQFIVLEELAARTLSGVQVSECAVQISYRLAESVVLRRVVQ